MASAGVLRLQYLSLLLYTILGNYLDGSNKKKKKNIFNMLKKILFSRKRQDFQQEQPPRPIRSAGRLKRKKELWEPKIVIRASERSTVLFRNSSGTLHEGRAIHAQFGSLLQEVFYALCPTAFEVNIQVSSSVLLSAFMLRQDMEVQVLRPCDNSVSDICCRGWLR